MKAISRFIKAFKSARDVNAQRLYRIGKRRFILYGIAWDGGTTFVFWQVKAFLDPIRLGGRFLIYWLVTSLFICVCAGWLFGWILWRGAERRVSRLSKQ